MTFHRTLLVLRGRSPAALLAGHYNRHTVTKQTVSSFLAKNTHAHTGGTPSSVQAGAAAGQSWGSMRSMTTMVNWPGENDGDASMTPARAKLQQVLEEYRQNNFSQTLFSRFLKEMIQATDANHDGYISRSELSKLLDNIGAKGKLSDTEVQEIMDELGQMDGEQQELLIHIEDLEDTILKGVQ